MATDLRFENRLDGSSNYSTWRERTELVLEENRIWEFVDKSLKTPTGATTLAKHKKKYVKSRRIILDGVKDHVVPHLTGKKTTREMWETLAKLYQSDNHNKKMVLKEKLRRTMMSKTEIVTFISP
jgi:2-phosphoglycerate kinase